MSDEEKVIWAAAFTLALSRYSFVDVDGALAAAAVASDQVDLVRAAVEMTQHMAQGELPVVMSATAIDRLRLMCRP